MHGEGERGEKVVGREQRDRRGKLLGNKPPGRQVCPPLQAWNWVGLSPALGPNPSN